MKVLNLRFRNLNSLVGDFVIDFTRPEYNGIFAIIGPTGAGKSTILDAICLALYGRTPRLKSISKSTNEIMSRLTRECFAEVTFEVATNKFRCHWSQRRTGKKADAKLSESKHELSNANTGQILGSKKRDVANLIESKTGMDFDRFTRSIFLAQGGFSTFLQAQPSDRSPILERITGTEVYSDISKHVHERYRAEQLKLDELKAELGGVTYLKEMEETLLKAELKDKNGLEEGLKNKANKLGKAIAWLNEIDSIKDDLSNLDIEYEDLQKELELFKPDRDRLDRAIRANDLEGDYKVLFSKRQEYKDVQELLSQYNKQLPLLQVDLDKAKKAYETSVTNTIRRKDEQADELKLINEVRILDSQILSKNKEISSATNDYEGVKGQLNDNDITRSELLKAEEGFLQDLKEVKDYILSNGCDEGLLTGFAGIKGQINGLKQFYGELSSKESQIKDCKKQKDLYSAEYERQYKHLSGFESDYKSIEKQLTVNEGLLKRHLKDHILKDYRDERDRLSKKLSYQKVIESLENKRKRLEDGKACPLCGSLDHPFARDNIPKADDSEIELNKLSALISKAERLEDDIKAIKDEKDQLNNKLVEAKEVYKNIEHKLKESQSNLKRLEDENNSISDRVNNLKVDLLSELSPFGISDLSNLDTIILELENRLKKWMEYKNKKAEIEDKKGEIALNLKELDGIIKTLSDSLKAKEDNINSLKGEYEGLNTSRNKIYGSKSTDDEERRFESMVKGAEECEAKYRQNMDAIRDKLNDLNARISALDNDVKDNRLKLDGLESLFIEGYRQAGFDNEDSFTLARLGDKDRDRLAKKADDLEKKKADIQSRKSDREKRLANELSKSLTKESLDSLKKDLDDTNNSLEDLHKEIGAIKQRLSDNDSAKELGKAKELLVESQQKEFNNWALLHSLIGSADGKKYRDFAQGLTFDFMINYANRQLKKMTDRYLLVSDNNKPLELSIIDNYQAGEVRSIKNLSGGESFIMSLSLALGLSDMASHKVRVDSLFLDEGFGTLDEESLNTVLEALSNLQQDGKLIGIISHVSALKEWISTQITVNPSGATSTISGPGCSAKLGY